jgi:hypothetical protein
MRRRRQRTLLAVEWFEDRTLLSGVPASVLAAAFPLDLPSASFAANVFVAPLFFEIAAGTESGLLDATVSARGGAVRLSLLDGGGNLVMQSDGISAVDGRAHLTEHVTGGKLYLEVQSLNSPGSPPLAMVLTTYFVATTDPFASLPPQQSVARPIAVGDFTGNGILDYATGAGVYLGAGDGTFSSEPAAPLPGVDGSAPTPLAAGRFTSGGPTELAIAVGSEVTINQSDASGVMAPLDTGPIELGDGETAVALTAIDNGGNGLDDLAILVQQPSGQLVEIWRNDGTGNFQESGSAPIDSGAVGLAAGRFNGDTATDLAVLIEGGTAQQGGVLILRGDGQGSFRPGTLIPIPGNDYLLGIAAGNFSGDGRTGLAVSSTGLLDGVGTVTLLAANGQGSFNVQTRIPVARSLELIAAGDFNNDGRTDLVVSNSFSPDVTILLARPGGSYIDASPPDFAPLAVADVNGDRIPDEITPLGVFLGVGDGSFRTPSEPLPGAGAGTSAILAAPLLPGDTTPDLAVANYDRGEITILQGIGGGQFRLVETLDVGGHPTALAAVTENGRTELAVADPTAGTVTLLAADGGVFHARQVLPVGLRPVALSTVDLNGFTEIAVVDEGDGVSPGAVDILLSNGDGTYRNGETIAVGVQPSAITAADFNRDGTTDLAVTNLASGSVSVLLGNGDGTFRAAAPVDLGAGSDPVDIVVDVPRRGGPFNLVVAERGTPSVAVLAGDGDGTFHALPPIDVKQPPLGLAVARFIAGPIPGLAVADRSSTDVALLQGNLDGTFNSQVANSLGFVPTGIVAGQFIADGNTDLAIANFQSNSISILLGNGDGTFRNGETIPVGSSPYPIAEGDFNGDGRTDLAVGDYVDGFHPGDVRILLGNGDGTFRAGQIIPLGIGAFSIAVADVNHDGHPDLIVDDLGLTDARGTIWVLLGNGDGTFRIGGSYTVGGGPAWVDVADFNGDGSPDIAVADTGWPGTDLTGNVMVLWGNGHGQFPTSTTIDYSNESDSSPQIVVAGNFLAPGQTELAVLALSNDAQSSDVTIWGFAGSSGFQALDRVPLPAGDVPIYMAKGNFSGEDDGREGLALVDFGITAVTVLNPGPGFGLEAGTPVHVGSNPGAIAVGDFNGDGLADFAVPTQEPGALSVWLNLGEGLFGVPHDANLIVPDTVLPVDLGTGVTDLLSVDSSGAILWRKGQPDAPGMFNPPLTINPNDPSRGIALVSDAHSSGRLLVSLDLLDNRISIFTFENNQFNLTDTLTTGKIPAQILSADINGDGISDLAVRNAGDGSVSLFFGRGDGTFDSGKVVALGPNISDLALAVVDGTKLPDLIATDATTGLITVLYNDGHGSFGTSSVIYRAGTGPSVLAQFDDGTSQVTSGDQTAEVAVATFAGSRHPSLVAIDPGNQSLVILDGLGDGRFANPRLVDLGMAFQFVQTFALRAGGPASDVAALGPDGLSVFQDNGAGGLSFLATYDVDPNATGLAVADLNGDGATDLLVSNRYGDVLVLYGDGNGTFRPFVNANQQSYLTVDGSAPNGQPVFVYSNHALDQVSVQVGVGTPVPLPAGQQPLNGPGPVMTADLAGTGIPDLIVVNSSGNSVLVYPGLGSGKFGAPRSFPVGDDPVSLTVADVNGDNIPDLIVANYGSNDVSVLTGSRAGGMWSASYELRLQAGYGPTAVAVSNLLGGAFKDVVVTDSLSNQVRVIPGLGGGFFDDLNPVIFRTGSDPVGVVVLPPGDSRSRGGLITLNAGSNDLTFIGGLGTAAPFVQNVASGGELPFAAVPVTDPLTGAEQILVANSADGRLSLFQVNPDGLGLVDTFLAPGLAHPTALAVDAFGDVFGVSAATQGAVLIALGFGPGRGVANGGLSTLAESNASSGLEEQLVIRLESLGGVALAATFSAVLVESTGGASEAGVDVVALAVPGAVPQPIVRASTARDRGEEEALEPANADMSSRTPAQPARGQELSEKLVDVLLGQDGELDELRRDIVRDLLRDREPPSPPPPETGKTPDPAPPPVSMTIDPRGEAVDLPCPETPPVGDPIDTAIGLLAADSSSPESDRSDALAGFRIGRLSWTRVLAAFCVTTLPLLMTDVARHQRRDGRVRWLSVPAKPGDARRSSR